MENTTSIFLKDTSTNGTYLNWEKLKKNSAAVKVCHGDIISFSAPPHNEVAFAFVYREVHLSNPVPDNAVAKRKAEDFVSENKRLKGLGIGAPEGPISLDDFRSLQKSNSELRKQLESQVVIIDTLRSDNRTAVERHESELKSAKESITKCFHDQVEGLQQTVDLKQKELGDVNKNIALQTPCRNKQTCLQPSNLDRSSAHHAANTYHTNGIQETFNHASSSIYSDQEQLHHLNQSQNGNGPTYYTMRNSQTTMLVETMQIMANSQLDLALPASHENNQTRPSQRISS
ncbi:hypothetical protein KIW84_070245 [Lathyrus oleraceus]|uniref:FHA domain-containing protein n=2 Tax=Pisum sativum TaxID=3888 RepID=A0A9D4VFT5_PEA|nr:hypothetical protein KIW84_070244 [Pisum sativum]KAI5382751.1 hypothetical protein KIW84_070245 [Pisum sativum]